MKINYKYFLFIIIFIKIKCKINNKTKMIVIFYIQKFLKFQMEVKDYLPNKNF